MPVTASPLILNPRPKPGRGKATLILALPQPLVTELRAHRKAQLAARMATTSKKIFKSEATASHVLVRARAATNAR
jgi:hypothetical protein